MSPVLAQPSHSSGANTSAPMTHTFQPLHPFARLELVLGPVPAVHHGHVWRQTSIHTNIHTYSQFKCEQLMLMFLTVGIEPETLENTH